MIKNGRYYFENASKLKNALRLGFSCYMANLGPMGGKTLKVQSIDWEYACVIYNRTEYYYYLYDNEEEWISDLINDGIIEDREEYEDNLDEYSYMSEEDWAKFNCIAFEDEVSQGRENWITFDQTYGEIYFIVDDYDDDDLEEFGLRKVWVEDA